MSPHRKLIPNPAQKNGSFSLAIYMKTFKQAALLAEVLLDMLNQS